MTFLDACKKSLASKQSATVQQCDQSISCQPLLTTGTLQSLTQLSPGYKDKVNLEAWHSARLDILVSMEHMPTELTLLMTGMLVERLRQYKQYIV
eukprot:3001501-Amphidinium_carterae.1